MTATNGAPDPVAAAEERWQRLQDQLETVGIRMRTETGSAIASIDACLRRLDTVRQDLADRLGVPPSETWPPDPRRPECATCSHGHLPCRCRRREPSGLTPNPFPTPHPEKETQSG